MTKEKFLETTNGTSVGAAMEDGNWLEQRHLFEVNMDGWAGLEELCLGGYQDSKVEPIVTHTAGNSDIVHEAEEDMIIQEGRRFQSRKRVQAKWNRE